MVLRGLSAVFQEGGCEMDVVGRDPVTSQKIQDLPAVKKFKNFVRTFVPEALSPVGIDMIHKKGDVILCQRVEGSPLWDHVTDQFMVFLRGAFLSGRGGITIEHLSPAVSLGIKLDGLRI